MPSWAATPYCIVASFCLAASSWAAARAIKLKVPYLIASQVLIAHAALAPAMPHAPFYPSIRTTAFSWGDGVITAASYGAFAVAHTQKGPKISQGALAFRTKVLVELFATMSLLFYLAYYLSWRALRMVKNRSVWSVKPVTFNAAGPYAATRSWAPVWPVSSTSSELP